MISPFDNSLTAEAWCTSECKRKNDNQEAKHEQGYVNQSDHLPTAEPNFTIPAHCLNSTPETVREMEPNGYQPDDVQYNKYRIAECQFNITETISRIAQRIGYLKKFGKHHVVPEIKQMEAQTQ